MHTAMVLARPGTRRISPPRSIESSIPWTADSMRPEGARVSAGDNNQGRLDAGVDALTRAGGTAHGRLADALDPGQVDTVVAEVARAFGAIDILVNAVGGSTIIPRPAAV